MSGRAGKRGAQRQKGEFSSDDELVRRSPRFGGKKQTSKTASQSAYMADVCQLSDEELMEELRQFGETPGPIVDTTRGLYQKKLARLMAEKTKASSQARRKEAEEVVDYGTDQLGEWSSQSSEEETDPEPREEGGEGEEEEAGALLEEPASVRRVRSQTSTKIAYVSYSTPTRHVESSYLLRKPKDSPTKMGGSKPQQSAQKAPRPRPPPSGSAVPPSKPTKPAKQPASPEQNSIWSTLLSLALLLVMFSVTFLVYDYSQNAETSFLSQALDQLRQWGVVKSEE